MRVTEGTSFELSDGTWQKPEIELDDADFERTMVEWGVSPERAEKLPLQLRYELMSTLARQLLVVRHIQSRARDTRWVQEEGKPMYQAVSEELSGLYKKVTQGS